MHRAKYEYGQAVHFCAEALRLDPQHLGAMSLYGRLKAILGHHQEAREIFSAAVKLAPENAALLVELASILRGMGDFDAARDNLKKAVAVDKTFAPAFYTLAGIHRFEPGDPLIDDYVRLKKKVYGNPAWRCLACFSLGKLYDDLGEWDLAFENYAEANQRRPAQYDYVHKKNLLEAIKQMFTPEMMRSRDQTGHPSQKPVFIVGMLRSGSSLVEEMLSRSEDIDGLGEPQDIEDLFAAAYQHVPGENNKFSIKQMIDSAQFESFGETYLERLQKIAPDAKRLIDKNLFNHTLLGFVRLLFPNAAIIHSMRDPIDTCLSCYFQNFTEGHDYSFDLGDMARHYAAYSDIMEHWNALFGAEIFDASYERMIGDKDAAIAGLFAHVKMPAPGEEALTTPATRAIPTASAWQARQPLYSTSVKRWKHYEKHLGPLFKALEDEGFDYSGAK